MNLIKCFNSRFYGGVCGLKPFILHPRAAVKEHRAVLECLLLLLLSSLGLPPNRQNNVSPTISSRSWLNTTTKTNSFICLNTDQNMDVSWATK